MDLYFQILIYRLVTKVKMFFAFLKKARKELLKSYRTIAIELVLTPQTPRKLRVIPLRWLTQMFLFSQEQKL